MAITTGVTVAAGGLEADPCKLVNSILAYEDQLIAAVMSKFDSLQRLVELLFEMGESVLNAIPRPSDFLPVISIDMSLYTQLRGACPQLGLPPVGELPLNKLQEEVDAAYLEFFSKIYMNHPWGLIQSYRSQVNDAMNDAFNKLGRPWLVCAATACGVVKAASTGNLISVNDRFEALIKGDTDLLTSRQKTAYNDFISQRNQTGQLLKSEASKEQWNSFFPKELV
jgi:hypothetical protein